MPGIMSLTSPMADAALARYTQLKQSGMPDQQILQLMDQEKTMIPLGQLAAKLMALKQASQQTPMPPQNTINEQVDQQLQQMQQGLGSLPEGQQGQGQDQQGQQAPQGGLPPQGGPPPQMPPQGGPPPQMPPQGDPSQQGMPQGGPPPQMPPQGMPPQGMAAGGLAGLPVHNVGDSSAYAAGGIVAFNDGGDVKHFVGGGINGPLSMPITSGGPFGSTMTYQGPGEATQLERLEELYSMPPDFSKYASGYDPETLKLRSNPEVRRLYEQLKAEQRKTESAAAQANKLGSTTYDPETSALHSMAEKHGINLAPPTAELKDQGPSEDTTATHPGDIDAEERINAYVRQANAPTTQANIPSYRPAQPTTTSTPLPSIGAGAQNDIHKDAMSREDYMNEYFNTREAYEKEHGIGEAEGKLAKYLEESTAQEAKDYEYDKSMTLAKFGLRLMSTPGPFLTALGKAGVESADDFLALSAKHRAALKAANLAKLQADAAKEKGDSEKFDAAFTYGVNARNKAEESARQAATLVREDKQLQATLDHYRVMEAQGWASENRQAALTNVTISDKRREQNKEDAASAVWADSTLTDKQKRNALAQIYPNLATTSEFSASSANANTANRTKALAALSADMDYMKLKAAVDKAPLSKKGDAQHAVDEYKRKFLLDYGVNDSIMFGGGDTIGGSNLGPLFGSKQ